MALKQVETETPLLIQREKYTRMLNSMQACWSLMEYLADTENGKNILRFMLNPDKTKTFFLNIANAIAFMKDLPKYFYGSGLELYLPQSILALHFEYRSMLLGVMISDRNNLDDQIILNNENMVNRMTGINKELLNLHRNELDLATPKML